jgi:hypothetical protein
MSGPPATTGPALSRPIRWDVATKAGGGARRLVVLSREDEAAFARSAAGVAPFICAALRGESHANRIGAWDPTGVPVLEPWRRARRRWSSEVRRLGDGARFVAVTDVRACYPSISESVTMDRLRALRAPVARVVEIGTWLSVFRDAGVDGLPVGPAASALLADAVLSAGDEAIRLTGATHVRWVDDVAIFAPDPATRAAALEAVRRALAGLGLELHDGKTLLFDDTDAAEAHLGAMSNSPAASFPLR